MKTGLQVGLETSLPPEAALQKQSRWNWQEVNMASRINTRLTDAYGRTLDYLRISLTDRCDFRCVYCLPPEGVDPIKQKAVLATDEVLRLARVFAALGVCRVRLTGGEPLLRKDIVSLVRGLSTITGIEELLLTTNGSRLAGMVGLLKQAGLKGVNISIDSLQRQRFSAITGRDRLREVVCGLQQAVKQSLKVKINTVALKGLSRVEVHDLCDLAYQLPIEVRFLEVMPLCGSAWQPNLGLSLSTVRTWIEEKFKLVPLARHYQPAESFSLQGGVGRIGFIQPLSQPFCHTCNRLRLTADGTLRLCLYAHASVDLCRPLRQGASDREIGNIIKAAIWHKPLGYEVLKNTTNHATLPKIRQLGG